MSGPLHGQPNLIITGVSHRTGSVGLRDNLFIGDDEIGETVSRLRGSGAEGILVVSTCDRVELHVAGNNAEASADTAREILIERSRGDRTIEQAIYRFGDEAAFRHLFRVAASLESQVVGEPQVLGQIKAAHRLSRDAGGMSAGFDAILQAAYAAAKQVRSETRIAERPVSIAAAAAAVARDVHGDLDDVRALMIGDGDMGIIVAEALLARGLGDLVVVHRSMARAEALARRLGCHVSNADTLASGLSDADIVLCAMGRRGYALSADMARGALEKRARKSVLALDLAVPGDIDPAVDRLDDIYLFDLANLDALASHGAHSREAEVPAAEAIIERALGQLLTSGVERNAVPALTRLRRRIEEVREHALLRAGGDAEKATRLMAGRLLHGPSVNLRRLAARDGDEALSDAERLLDRLFDDPDATSNGDDNEH